MSRATSSRARATRLRRLGWAAALVAACAVAPAVRAGGVPKPFIQPARGGKCIAPPAVMRREHMAMLLRQRELTVHEGVRGAKVDLRACVDCHAGRVSDSVASRPQDFCVSCHAYVGVKIDCFQCHSDRPDHELHASTPPAVRTITAMTSGAWQAQRAAHLGHAPLTGAEPERLPR